MASLFDQIEDEIKAGHKNESDRISEAKKNIEFYNGDFSRYLPNTIKNLDKRFVRTSPIMQRIVRVLTSNLYAEGPKRSLQAPSGGDEEAYRAASEWLNGIYKESAVDAFFQDADRYSTAADFCAFQVITTTDPKRPVRLLLWKADELVVFLSPTDPLTPVAVATIDRFDNRRRLTLWTDTYFRVYETDKYEESITSGGTAYNRSSGRIKHPFGSIPFAFVHFDFPTSYFFTESPGTGLRKLNDSCNIAMTELFASIRTNINPVLVAKGMTPLWTPPKFEPGTVITLANEHAEGNEAATNASLDYLQCDPSFIAAGWDDAQTYLDNCLSMYGVPPSTIRLVQDSARSGISIVAEQIPLILWAQGRQRPFSYYESSLARVTLKVAAAHLAIQDFDVYRATAAQLALVAEEPGLSLRWASMYPRLPGEETDRQDQFKLDNKLRSRTQLLMEREGLTREEARAFLEETAKDLAEEEHLFGGADAPSQEDDEPSDSTEAEVTDQEPNDDQGSDFDLPDTDEDEDI